MSSDTPRFNPEPSTFTPAGDADLAADPSTGAGPDGAPLGDDTPGADVDAIADGDRADDLAGGAGGGPSGGASGGGAGSGGASGGGDDAPGLGSPEKDPSDWVTGHEPMTGPQASYLSTLAREAGEDVPEGLSKAQASEMIDRLQSRTGRGS